MWMEPVRGGEQLLIFDDIILEPLAWPEDNKPNNSGKTKTNESGRINDNVKPPYTLKVETVGTIKTGLLRTSGFTLDNKHLFELTERGNDVFLLKKQWGALSPWARGE